VRLNVGRTHGVTDTSICFRIIDIPALCSGGPELRPRPRRQLSWELPWIFFLQYFWERQNQWCKFFIGPSLYFLPNYLLNINPTKWFCRFWATDL